jgi:hypothetical protein
MTKLPVQLSEKQFLKALSLCQELVNFKCEASNLPCEAIELFCEVGRQPSELLKFSEKYPMEVEQAKKAVEQYARSIDNWLLSNCPFGVKDHCNILNFFLSLRSRRFEFFRGENFTPEMICDFLEDWKGIDLRVFLQNNSQLLSE